MPAMDDFALAAPTAPAWTECALDGIAELLVDHAHCEKKAAGTALNLIFRYPREPALPDALSRLAREELIHFEQVLAILRARGIAFAAQKPAAYAGRLRAQDAHGRPRAPRRHAPVLRADRGAQLRALRAARGGRARSRAARLLRGAARGRVAAPPRVRRARGIARVARRGGSPRYRELAACEAEILASTRLAPRMHAGALA
jgi:tRNA-(ms[2]io[6]A)-hydroxylase